MEREHLIIIALILVALYMMNNDKKQDKVKAISPMGRIRYGPLDGPIEGSHIRTRREGFYGDDQYNPGVNLSCVGSGGHIRLGDKYFGGSQHIKNHVRHNNRNNMFSGMMGDCGTPIPSIEKFGIDCELTPDLC
jgi:hypothetical protein